jgi:hypothetical protein
MGEPTIDRPRMPSGYGVPGTLKGALSWSWARERLDQALVYWVATTRADGRPHAMPTWGAWVDDAFWMEGSPQTQRMRNLTRNPAAVVHVEKGADVVIVEGEGQQIDDVGADLAERLLAGYAKYQASHGYKADASNWTGGGLWVIRPRKVLGWSSFPRDTTRWTFDR